MHSPFALLAPCDPGASTPRGHTCSKHLQGILTALDPRTGDVRYGPVRIPELPGVYASPVAVAGRIYAPSRDGRIVVFRHGPSFETRAVNSLR